MAIVKGIFQATGSIKGISFYSPVGSDKVIMRTKGGPSKERIAKGTEFAKLRQHQTEWAGCVQFAKAVRSAVGELYRLADYNLSPVWTGMGKSLIKLDTDGEVGQRPVRLTTYKQALEGFSFNKLYPLNSILRVSPSFTIDRKALLATVTFPRINTDMDLQNVQRLPYFRLIITLGGVSDIVYNPIMQTVYQSINSNLQGISQSNIGEWLPTNGIFAEQSMIVQFTDEIIAECTDDMTLLLGIGLEFGTVGFGGGIVEVKRAGCAKIVKVG